MESKNILVILSDTPLGRVFINETLRNSLGMSAGYKEHKVSILFTGDSVLFALMPVDNSTTSRLVKALDYLDASLYLDKKALDDRSIQYDLIESPFHIVDRPKVLELIKKTNLTVSL